MKLIDEIYNVIKGNFYENETDINSLIETCSLYFITENHTIYYVEKIDKNTICDTITSLCFISKNTLCCVCTNKNFQRKGYSKQILSNILLRYDYLNLCVRVSNYSAIKLYLELGFVIKKLYDNFYSYTIKNEHAFFAEYRK